MGSKSYTPAPEGDWLEADEDENPYGDHLAAEWHRVGFHDPAVIRQWEAAVSDPEVAAHYNDLGITPREAIIWDEVIRNVSYGIPVTIDEVFEASNGQVNHASNYAKFFPVKDWAFLVKAFVKPLDAARVYRLVAAIETRDTGKDRTRESIIFEAVNWLDANPDRSATRLSLLNNLILMGRELKNVRFIMANSDSSVPAVAAAQANDYVEEGEYKLDAEGYAAYNALAYFKEINTVQFDQLVRTYGIRKVVSALDANFDRTAHLEHYIVNGGVAEIARGAL